MTRIVSLLRRRDRWIRLGGGLTAAVLACATLGRSADLPSSQPLLPGATSPASKSAERLREGTRLTDVSGAFQEVGDRLSFLPSGNKESLPVLENLARERVSRTLSESRGPRQWVVSGLVTEYRGANYLLVTKAVVQLQDGEAARRP